MSSIQESARSSKFLEERIANNDKSQQLNFNQWIFSHLVFSEKSKVLELCSGTGAQTEFLASGVYPNGKVKAVDVSGESLATLRGKLDRYSTILDTVCSDIDNVGDYINDEENFDLIFCSYGLYYSRDVLKLLECLKSRLSGVGAKMAVCGPYGDNNKELFDFLASLGVKLDVAVTSTCTSFMGDIVLRFFVEHFQSIKISTVSNVITWDSPELFITYWKNTTFFDESLLNTVIEGVNKFFSREKAFIFTKHIMLLEGSAVKL